MKRKPHRDGGALPLPVCGERVGERGNLRARALSRAPRTAAEGGLCIEERPSKAAYALPAGGEM